MEAAVLAVPPTAGQVLFHDIDLDKAGPAVRDWLLDALGRDFEQNVHPSFYAAWSSEEVLCDDLDDISHDYPTQVALYVAACRELKLRTASLAGPGDSWKPLQAALGSVAQQD